MAKVELRGSFHNHHRLKCWSDGLFSSGTNRSKTYVSRRCDFEDRDYRSGRDDAPERQADIGQQATELLLRPFARVAEDGHHLRVDQIAGWWAMRRIGVEELLADKQQRILGHSRAAGAQDAAAVLVAPVVQHAD